MYESIPEHLLTRQGYMVKECVHVSSDKLNLNASKTLFMVYCTPNPLYNECSTTYNDSLSSLRLLTHPKVPKGGEKLQIVGDPSPGALCAEVLLQDR